MDGLLVLLLLFLSLVQIPRVKNKTLKPSILEWLEVQAVTHDKTFMQQNSIITLQNDRQTLEKEMSLSFIIIIIIIERIRVTLSRERYSRRE